MDDEGAARGGSVAPVRVLRVGPSGRDHRADTVVVEEPLQVHVRHRGGHALLGSTMRTPGHDHELAVGLAVAEGVVRGRADVLDVRHCGGDRRWSESDVTVGVSDDVDVDPAVLGRVAHPSSACGMCGRDHIDALLGALRPVVGDVVTPSSVLVGLPDAMSAQQRVFRRTGGLHAVALAHADGSIVAVREDVGRHNAVDKVVGAALLDGLAGDVLVVSGRVGFEIVQKAAMAGVPVVCAVSAPTSLAVEAARAVGLTLVAFVRDGRMSVYAGEHRVEGAGAASSW